MWAWSLGMRRGEALACTMAFSALTLARLFHGFNCRSSYSIIQLGLLSNPGSLAAFMLGSILLAAVLLCRGCRCFAASDLMPVQAAAVGMAAFLPTVVIQLGRIFRDAQQ